MKSYHSLLLLLCLLLQQARAEIVINEIMFDISRGENLPEPISEEFLELHNTGAAAVSLAGWELDAGVRFVFPALSIPPDAYVVVAADPVAFAAKYPAVSSLVVGPWTGRLSNSGEKIRLRNELGEEVDELTYSDEGDWALRRRGPLDNGHEGWVWESTADGAGGSLELINPALTNRQGQNWKATPSGAETPGAVNGAFTGDAAPMILEVRHSPAIPSASDQVIITADLKDIVGEALSATVSYGTDSNNSANRTIVVMTDDALNGDGDAGDDIFGATLPAFPDGTVVDFFISASDGVNTRTWPGPTDETGGQGANALFQVEATQVASDQGLPVYRLILSPDEKEEFEFENFDDDSDAQMNATFISQVGDDVDVRYLAGIRRRGAGSRSRDPRTFRLSLAADRPWQDTTKMNLNAQFNYMQLFGQKLFAAARLPSAKARSIELFLNAEDESVVTGRLLGAYVHLEPQGSDSVARQFPDDPSGNLYSKRRPDTKLAYRDGNIDDYIDDGWDKETNNSEADWSDLDAWLAVIRDSTNPNYLADLEAVMDVDQWVRWLAVMTLVANGETNISTGADDDYYVYAGRQDPRIKAVPHDLDTILGLGDGSAITDPSHTIYDMIEDDDVIPVLVPFIRNPEVLRKYHQALRDLIEGPFSKNQFDELLTNCLTERVPDQVIRNIVTFMDARRNYVLGEVNPGLSVESTLPVEGGYPKATNASPGLSGVINISEATSVEVNGRPAVIDAFAGSWSFNTANLGETAFINAGASWRYLDNGSNQGSTWREVAFDDSDWKTGNGEFGYGNNSQTTEILFGPSPFNFINNFTNGNNRFITTYFRKEVIIADPSVYQDVLLRLKRDDGAAVYVNGVLQVLDNLPENPAFNTQAIDVVGDEDEQTFYEFSLPTSAFVAGSNTIAVELHNAAPCLLYTSPSPRDRG